MKIATIVGARPHFIKAATISRAIAKHDGVNEVLIHTGQHFDANMSDIFFAELDIRLPDYHLGIGGGSHGQNTGRMVEAIEGVLLREQPDWVLVYGDTDTTLAGALAAVKLNIPLAHVEAGVRSFNRCMPEEINRVLTDHAADLLFAPTESAVTNLLAEGISGDKVQRVGDVMLDATSYYKQLAIRPTAACVDGEAPFVLCTVHRPENTNDPARLTAIVLILNQISASVPVVLPLHPRTRAALDRLSGVLLNSAVRVIEPLGFIEMTWLVSHCQLVLTDSGGLQKEAYFHQKPCITLREETEWVELVHAGYNHLFPPFATNALEVFEQMREVEIPADTEFYGDGNAATKIVLHLSECGHKCTNQSRSSSAKSVL
jgi:UDP-GlcNAc3NAcA epimerase